MNKELEVVREDPENVTKQVLELIAEGKAAFEHILALLGEGLRNICQNLDSLSEPTDLHRALAFLGARFYCSAEAGLLLLCRGHLLPACAMSRDMVEILVVLQYLQRHPGEAGTFTSARTETERKRYRIAGLSKQIPSGRTYRQHFDMLSAYIHPSAISSGAILRPTGSKADKLYLGAYYQPYLIALELTTQMALSLELVFRLTQSYSKRMAWPLDHHRFRLLKAQTLQYFSKLKDTAAKRDLELEKTSLFVKALSLKKLEDLWDRLL